MIIPAKYDWIYQLYVEYISSYKNADYYYKNGNLIMTKQYHTKRGSCCGNGCKHCPYDPIHQAGSTLRLN